MATTGEAKPCREILVVMENGVRRLVSNIPPDAKVTYGPVQPGKQDYGRQNALRIYTSQSNQLAVFVGVSEFRDTSLCVKEQKVIEKAFKVTSPNERSSEANTTTEWTDA